ncbi:hypothetical protein ACHAWF_017034 [Thalassiosira exigua]
MEDVGPEINGFESGEGYEQDVSRMADENSISSRSIEDGVRKKASNGSNVFARKRKAVEQTAGIQCAASKNNLTGSGYEQDVSGDMAVFGNGEAREEETQVLLYTLGSYVDHSLVPDDDRVFAPIHRKPTFPESLYAILSNPDLSNVIEWSSHGRSFRILNRDEFSKSVLPVYYRHSNLSSFNRQLNGYGFKKIRLGPYEKSYFHPFFLRNLPHLVKNMTRRSSEMIPDEGQPDILYENQLERVSEARPLPKRMSNFYADELKKINQRIYQSDMASRLREQSQVPAFAAQNELGSFPVPSVIYTPSPNPLPQAIYTPQTQLRPESQEGTVFAQTHLPLTGLSPSLPMQSNFQPPFLQQQQSIGQGISFPVQPIITPATSVVQGQGQLPQERASEIAKEAQVQLFANAFAAAMGHQGRPHQSFINDASLLMSGPTLNTNAIQQEAVSDRSNQNEVLNQLLSSACNPQMIANQRNRADQPTLAAFQQPDTVGREPNIDPPHLVNSIAIATRSNTNSQIDISQQPSLPGLRSQMMNSPQQQLHHLHQQQHQQHQQKQHPQKQQQQHQKRPRAA